MHPLKLQANRRYFVSTSFFGGCIRVKISVLNTSSLVIIDAALEPEFDDKILHFDRWEPEYTEKKGTDINYRVSFKDAFGRPDVVQMETLKIKVVCPIFRTEQDINIGRLKELVSKLQFHDSKVYVIPKRVEPNI